MTNPPRWGDWQILGLEPGADLAQVKRAFRYRRSLYDPSSLATYTLIDENERERMLARIDEAYRRIAKAEPQGEPGSDSLYEAPRKHPEVPTGPPPNPDTEPGNYLRHHRLIQGLSIEHIATETKVSALFLDQVEREDFEALPAPVFVRGYVLQFAKALGLRDVEKFSGIYVNKMEAEPELE